MLALLLGFWLQLESASSAAVTVAILAQPRRGEAFRKAAFRIGATAVGVIASIVIVGLFAQARDLYVVAFAAWMALAVYIATLYDGSRAYGAVLSGYTVAIVAVMQIDSPQNVFLGGMERLAAVSLGIASIALVNDVFAAPTVYPSVRQRLRQAAGPHAGAGATGGARRAVAAARGRCAAHRADRHAARPPRRLRRGAGRRQSLAGGGERRGGDGGHRLEDPRPLDALAESAGRRDRSLAPSGRGRRPGSPAGRARPGDDRAGPVAGRGYLPVDGADPHRSAAPRRRGARGDGSRPRRPAPRRHADSPRPRVGAHLRHPRLSRDRRLGRDLHPEQLADDQLGLGDRRHPGGAKLDHAERPAPSPRAR